ncbi:hypothetical protein CHARACLAT_007461 [Characodon lateralis]|uniref:Prefoldin subunit n=1 Tax=Characodon lateralis TaxID=208331 RepID=A0ABU7ERP1_9TELE|nr:hypothetical protein [Characodon lateralis]
MARNLTGDGLPRLEWFKPRILQEAEFLVFSVRQLKEADAESARALETLEILIRRRKDEFLVPLTSCMCVPATVNLEPVMVNVGAGFLVEMNVEEAKAFLKRQKNLISKQMGKVQSFLEDSSIIKGIKASALTAGPV